MEVGRLALGLGSRLSLIYSGSSSLWSVPLIVSFLPLIVYYLWRRDILVQARKIARSARFDILISVISGALLSLVLLPTSSRPHDITSGMDPLLGAVVLGVLAIIVASSGLRDEKVSVSEDPVPPYFLTDDAITDLTQDELEHAKHAINFADIVLASKSHAGLVLGLDGPWGVGKTSFVNLVENRLAEKSSGGVFVHRFEPLRYGLDSDYTERFIRDLTATIQRHVFVPEFKFVANRYSRMLKGKADVSFFGFKLSMEPSSETIEELLEDIDDVLASTGCRLVVVVDDLDRLDAKAVNGILFVVRRTLRLKRATYVLCYDTENLVSRGEDGDRAREFLEKFINVKITLFASSGAMRDYFAHGWNKGGVMSVGSSIDRARLDYVMTSISAMLDGPDAARYMEILGNVRKAKRFINAALMLQVRYDELGVSDINAGDLANLILVYLNYPGLFRRIYDQETGGRVGFYSVRRKGQDKGYENTDELLKEIALDQGVDKFLLSQLFSVKALRLDRSSEESRRTRACFNEGQNRNLEAYLELIVKWMIPKPEESFSYYQKLAGRIASGDSVRGVINSGVAPLRERHAYESFWGQLTERAPGLNRNSLQEAIHVLMEDLPKQSILGAQSMRNGSVYSLLRLIESYGAVVGGRDALASSAAINSMMFGSPSEFEGGIIRALVTKDRGVLGWHDLVLFRLQCSADRGGQLYRIQEALVVGAGADWGVVQSEGAVAVVGMRRISQILFEMFRAAFIDSGVNFLSKIQELPESSLVGTLVSGAEAIDPLEFDAARLRITSFMTYQLCNKHWPSGSGIGIGAYDEAGLGDAAGIADVMNSYVFDFCFNPEISEKNAIFFCDHCLSHLTDAVFAGIDGEGYLPTKESLVGGFQVDRMGAYWIRHGEKIKGYGLTELDRVIPIGRGSVSYRTHLDAVFKELDRVFVS